MSANSARGLYTFPTCRPGSCNMNRVPKEGQKEHNLYQEKHQGRDRDNVPPWPPPLCKRAPIHVWRLEKVNFRLTSPLIFKPHPVRKSAITFFFCSAVLLPSSLLNWMQQLPVSFSLSFSQRPKKSKLSGWQTLTRKNFPDEVRKSFLRQMHQKSA